ncbi:MAG: trigger factor [Ferrimicrobium sp.]
MRSSAVRNADNTATLTIELRDDEVAPFVEKSIGRLQGQVRIPGFRRGHVPRQVLENRLGIEAVRREAIDDAVQELYESAAVDNGLDVITSPSMRIVSGEAEGDVSVEIDLTLRPVVSVEGYRDLAIQVPVVRVTDNDVNEILEALREQMAVVSEVERPVVAGDQVTVNVIRVSSEGEEEIVTPYLTVRVGKGTLDASSEESLIGLSVGDRVDITPGEDEDRPRVLEVLAVRELALPDPDDDFASQVSEFGTYEQLVADITTSLSRRRVEEARAAFTREFTSALMDLVEPKELPQSLVESAYQQELHEFGRVLDGSGISLKRYLEMSQQSESDLSQAFSVKAVQSVLWDLALRAIVMEEALECGDDEITAEQERLIAQSPPASRGELMSRLSRPFESSALRVSLLKQKAHRRVASLVVIRDANSDPVTLEELGLEDLVDSDVHAGSIPSASDEVDNKIPDENALNES